MYIEFRSKPPTHRFRVLHMEWTDNETTPTALLVDLASIGWKDPNPLPPIPAIGMEPGRYELNLEGPKGSGLFGFWTLDEARKLVKEVKQVLCRAGFTGRISCRKLRFEEII